MSESTEQPFDARRPRPVATVLDMLRARIDHDRFDAALFTLESVAADLGYGDVRPLPGAIAWIDRLRRRASGSRSSPPASGRRRRWSWPASPTASTSSRPARAIPPRSPRRSPRSGSSRSGRSSSTSRRRGSPPPAPPICCWRSPSRAATPRPRRCARPAPTPSSPTCRSCWGRRRPGLGRRAVRRGTRRRRAPQPASWMWSASAAPPNGRVRPNWFSVASETPSTPGVSEASPRVCGSFGKPPTSTECCGVR